MVGRTNVAAEVCAVHFDLARNGRAIRFRRHRFAQLMGHDERCLVLAIQVPAQLQGAMALCTVHENSDCQEVVADWELAARKNGPASHTELVIAGFAFEQLAGRIGVDGGAFTARAYRLALSGRPTDQFEGLVGFLVRQAGDLR